MVLLITRLAKMCLLEISIRDQNFPKYNLEFFKDSILFQINV